MNATSHQALHQSKGAGRALRVPAISLFLLLTACATTTTKPSSTLTDDPHSFSNPSDVAVQHLGLSLNVDFDRKVLSGTADLTLDNRSRGSELILDTRDLDIRRITLDDGSETQFRLGEAVQFQGRPLHVVIRADTKKVSIEYSTRPEAAALQWLSPSQTSGGKLPFLFTQSQAVLARTWVPIQDTPTVRMTYAATIRVPKELMAVMSAENPTKRSADGVYRFKMPQPIPSYLLALAVGDLEFRALDKRSGVYAEPSVVQKAAWELADTPKMINAAEELYGPYKWGRYDVLILPPSFPFGGMENPRLTFATPTILAGDRSLVSLVAHELAHSWSGNLVTNSTWNDFWLNEGFTTYFENRIMEHIYGREYADMLSALGLQGLRSTVTDLGDKSADTHLKLNLAGRDPDEGLSDIAYEKGRMFLTMLERSVGRERFDPFLRKWFDEHAFQSVDTEVFVDYLNRNLLANDPQLQATVREWVYGPGLPASLPVVNATRFARVDAEVKRFNEGSAASALSTKEWSTHEWLHFLRALPESIPGERLSELDSTFKLTESGNAEISHQWFLVAIRNEYRPAYPAIERYLTTIGRRKLVRPLYAALAKTPAGKQLALEIYRKGRPLYHAVTRESIDKDLGVAAE
jgi:leukotriene-A4 hydrolase